MIKKVIYIGYQPLIEKVAEDFFMDDLLSLGFKIEYWDLSQIYFPNVIPDTSTKQYVLRINNFKALSDRLSHEKGDECLYILNITFEYRVIKLFKLLSKNDCKTSFFARGTIPSCQNITSLKSKLLKAVNPSSLINFFQKKYLIGLKKLGRIKPYDYVFSAGKYGYLSVGAGASVELKKSHFVNVNSFDFDKFLETKSSEKLIEEKYCLFLDEYLPHHPDFKLLKIKSLDPDLYYKKLNSVFNLIEQKFQIKVVIAAHPKAILYRKMNPFEGRTIHFNKTAQLSKYCEFAIAHLSTSQSYAVLNYKPIFTLVCDDIKLTMPHYYNYILNYSQVLDTQLIQLEDMELGDLKIKAVDIDKYDNYKYSYLTTACIEQSRTFELVEDFLRKI